MKRFFTAVIFMIILSLPSFGQEAIIGVGASTGVLNILTYGEGDMNLNTIGWSIHVPINVSPQFRIEPTFFLYSGSYTHQDEGSSVKIEQNYTAFSIGSGFLYLFNVNKSTMPYLGVRIGYGSLSETDKSGSSEDENSSSILTFGGVLGGEYYFSPFFSLGVEVQLNYNIYGEPYSKTNGVEDKFISNPSEGLKPSEG